MGSLPPVHVLQFRPDRGCSSGLRLKAARDPAPLPRDDGRGPGHLRSLIRASRRGRLRGRVVGIGGLCCHGLPTSYPSAAAILFPVIAASGFRVPGVAVPAVLAVLAGFGHHTARGLNLELQWENASSEFVPIRVYDVEVRRVMCNTNAIEYVKPAPSLPSPGAGRSHRIRCEDGHRRMSPRAEGPWR